MNRSLLGLTSLSVFLLTVVTTTQALAWPATPEAPQCTVPPLPLEDVKRLLENSDSNRAPNQLADDTEWVVATPPPPSMPVRPHYDESLRVIDDVVPASETQQVAALEFINLYRACIEAGEFLRAFALVSPRVLGEVLADWSPGNTPEEILAALAAPPIASGDGTDRVLDPVDVEISVLPDSRLHVQYSLGRTDRGLEAEIFILDGSASGYTLADWYGTYFGDPSPVSESVSDPVLGTYAMIPDPSPAFVSLMATPTESNPHPVVATEYETDLRATHDYDAAVVRTLPAGSQLEVTAAPISVSGTIWIPVRFESTVGYVAAWAVVPVVQPVTPTRVPA